MRSTVPLADGLINHSQNAGRENSKSAFTEKNKSLLSSFALFLGSYSAGLVSPLTNHTRAAVTCAQTQMQEPCSPGSTFRGLVTTRMVRC